MSDETTSDAASEASAETTSQETASESQIPSMPDFAATRAALPTELSANTIFDQYAEGDSPRGLQGLFQDHAELQKYLGGERIVRPTKDSTDEEWGKFYDTMGRPEKAEAYDLGDFTPPENLDWDSEQQTALQADAHAAGLSNEQFKAMTLGLATHQSESMDRRDEQIVAAKNEAETALKAEWGPNYESSVARADATLVSIFGDNAAMIAKIPVGGNLLLGAHPGFIRSLADHGGKLGEHNLIPGSRGSAGAALNPAQAQEELDKMHADPDIMKTYLSPNAPGRDTVAKRMDALSRILHPEPTPG